MESFGSSHFPPERQKQIQNELNLKLGPEYVSYRTAPGGGRVAYIEGYAAFNLANRIFGFNGWSSSVLKTEVDYVRAS